MKSKFRIRFMIGIIFTVVAFFATTNVVQALSPDGFNTNLAELTAENWDVSGSDIAFSSNMVSFTSDDGTGAIGHFREFTDSQLISAIDNGNMTIDFSIDIVADVLEAASVNTTLNISFGATENDVFEEVDYTSTSTTESFTFTVNDESIPAGTRFILIEILIDETGTDLDFEASNASLEIEDTVVPSISSSYDDTWTNGDVEITLTATDASSGIAGIYDGSNNLLTTDETYLFTATTNGTYEFYAKDFAGQSSLVESVVIDNIDKTSPDNIIAPSVSETGWTNETITITFVELVTPAMQSEESYYVSIDGGPFNSFVGNVYQVSTSGEHTYEFMIKDLVGNSSANTTSVTTRYDDSSPLFDEVSLIASTTELTYNLTVSDDFSGISVIKYASGDQDASYFASSGTDITISESFTTSTPGIYTIYLEDNAGNQTTYQTEIDNLLLDFLAIDDETILEDEDLIVALDVTDYETSIDDFDVSFVSNNTSLIPNGNGYVDEGVIYIDASPLANQTGVAVITVSVTDEAGYSVDQVFTVTVSNIDDEPIANTDTIELDENSSITFDALENDVEPDNDELSYVEHTLPSNGSLVYVDGEFTYTPDEFFTGVDSFTYTITDGTFEVEGTVNITVNNINQSPIASTVSVTIDEDTPISIDIFSNYVVDEDLVYGLDSLTLATEVSPSLGSIVILDGVMTYTPYLNVFGTDVFSYRVTDEDGEFSIATITIKINSKNDAPSIVSVESVSPIEGTEFSFEITLFDAETSAGNLMVILNSLNTVLIDNNEIEITYIGLGVYEITIMPNANAFGDVTLTLIVSDGVKQVSQAINLTLAEKNDAP